MEVVEVVDKIKVALLVVREVVVVVEPILTLPLVLVQLTKAMLAQPAFNLIEAVVAVALAPQVMLWTAVLVWSHLFRVHLSIMPAEVVPVAGQVLGLAVLVAVVVEVVAVHLLRLLELPIPVVEVVVQVVAVAPHMNLHRAAQAGPV
jgi:hypothetical protein